MSGYRLRWWVGVEDERGYGVNFQDGDATMQLCGYGASPDEALAKLHETLGEYLEHAQKEARERGALLANVSAALKGTADVRV